MKHNIIAAAILALGLVVAAFLFTGRYYFIRLNECEIARGDKWTGRIINDRVSHDQKRCPWWDSM